VEEVRRDQGVGVGTQEHQPGVIAELRRRDAAGAKNSADGGGRDPESEPAQFTLDPHHSPPVVLPGDAHDQIHQILVDRRTPRAAWLSPLLGHEAPVPTQQRAGGNDPMLTQRHQIMSLELAEDPDPRFIRDIQNRASQLSAEEAAKERELAELLDEQAGQSNPDLLDALPIGAIDVPEMDDASALTCSIRSG
jgi:hypothetical protein